MKLRKIKNKRGQLAALFSNPLAIVIIIILVIVVIFLFITKPNFLFFSIRDEIIDISILRIPENLRTLTFSDRFCKSKLGEGNFVPGTEVFDIPDGEKVSWITYTFLRSPRSLTARTCIIRQ